MSIFFSVKKLNQNFAIEWCLINSSKAFLCVKLVNRVLGEIFSTAELFYIKFRIVFLFLHIFAYSRFYHVRCFYFKGLRVKLFAFELFLINKIKIKQYKFCRINKKKK